MHPTYISLLELLRVKSKWFHYKGKNSGLTPEDTKDLSIKFFPMSNEFEKNMELDFSFGIKD